MKRFSVLLLFLISFSSLAANYYVATTGNNSNAGAFGRLIVPNPRHFHHQRETGIGAIDDFNAEQQGGATRAQPGYHAKAVDVAARCQRRLEIHVDVRYHFPPDRQSTPADRPRECVPPPRGDRMVRGKT